MFNALAMQDIPALTPPGLCPACPEGLIHDGICDHCGADYTTCKIDGCKRKRVRDSLWCRDHLNDRWEGRL